MYMKKVGIGIRDIEKFHKSRAYALYRKLDVIKERLYIELRILPRWGEPCDCEDIFPDSVVKVNNSDCVTGFCVKCGGITDRDEDAE